MSTQLSSQVQPNHFLPESLANDLARKRLVFTITTGRSGTTYLANCLAHVPNVTCVHEHRNHTTNRANSEPDFASVREQLPGDTSLATQFWLEEKLPAIARKENPIYIETSHLFCKGFVEPLLDLGVTPDIIILTRSPRSISKSLCELQTVPGRTPLGKQYLINPYENPMLPLPQWERLSDYQLCYWYCLETERRQRQYEIQFARRGARVARTSLNFLRRPIGYQTLLKKLDLHMPSKKRLLKHWWKSKFKVNTIEIRKVPVEFPENLTEQENEVVHLMRSGLARKRVVDHHRDAQEVRKFMPFLPDMARPIEAPVDLRDKYQAYVSSVSAANMALSLETSALIQFLCQELKPQRILDLGSGFSSFVFRKYAATEPGTSVTSLDDDAQWLERTRNFLQQEGLSTENTFEWQKAKDDLKPEYDLILHDLGSLDTRADALGSILDLVRGTKSILIADDLHAENYADYVRDAVRQRGLGLFELHPLTMDDFGRHCALILDPQQHSN